ncbi:MAG TPA: two-component regulator propeller domain-containing protein [Longimicrobiaceae bacterium]|nr:two-component regulator propeller domain-containing protein [Longimicrobiaceae bacterium]
MKPVQSLRTPIPPPWRSARVGCALLLLVLAGGGAAAAQTTHFSQLSGSQGLASVTIRDMVQDREGFMWFGTTNGLMRYDGYRTTVYRRQRKDPHSIPNSSINVLYEDRAGTLWVGTANGLASYDRDHDRFRRYLEDGQGGGGMGRGIASLLEDSRGNFWVGSGGLLRLDRRTGRATPVRAPGLESLSSEWIQVLYEDNRHHLWIGTHAQGLYDYDPATGAVRVYAHDPADSTGLPDGDVRAVVQDPSGALWIGTYNAGLVRLDPRTGRMTGFRHDPGDPKSLADDRVFRIALDGSGGLWIGTEGGGLDHYDPARGDFEHNQPEPGDPTRLPTGSVWSVYRDRTGLLWVGTYTGGIRVATPNNRAIQSYAAIPDNPTSLDNGRVLGFDEGPDGTIWIATDGGGLNRLDPKTGTFTSYRPGNSDLNSGSILAVAADPGGGVWVGTWGGGISHLDPATGHFTAYTSKNSNLPDDNVFALHLDRRGRLWVGTWREGLFRFDPRTGSFVPFTIGKAGAIQSQIWAILELHDGRIVAATRDQGIVVVDPATGAAKRYLADVTSDSSLSSSEVRAVLEERPGVLWVGTASGLDQLDLRTGVATHLAEEDGLPSSAIAGLARDAAGNLWISTDRGITRYSPATGQSRTYTVLDGLQANDFTPRSYLTASDGTLYFGGNNGFNAIHPDRFVRNRFKPPVVLTGFQLFNHPVPIGAKGSPLRKVISETKRLVLNYKQSVFTFDFAALDYTAFEANEYAYKLDGFDRDWNYVGTSRTATYTNLSPGHYVFRVKASNEDGVWNEEGVALPITITPPWWATWWLRALVVLLVTAAVGALVRSARKRRKTLEGINRQLEAEIENAKRAEAEKLRVAAEAAERDRAGHEYLEGNVREMLAAMQRFSEGDHTVALAVETEDEIGRLRAGFNAVVADRKRAEEELRQSQKMEAVGRLAGGVAHDFNNLLTVIKGNAELALQDPATTETLREDLEEVQKAAERASGLTRQLLAFSRKQILQPRRLNFNEVVEEISRLLRRTMGEDVALETELAPALWPVRADRGQVEQVLLNLVVNARDAMPTGGRLRIRTANAPVERVPRVTGAERRAYVSLSVSDTGEGMEAGVKERIFEPFFTTKEQGKGTGLGLSTVYGIISQSGGFVEVESEVGRGSTFTVYLPRVEAGTEAEGAEASSHAPGGCETVLVVEDEAALRRLSARVLERSGYTVLVAGSGAEALEVARGYQDEIHLLLTDVVMPGMSGRELAERLLPEREGMRLLYTSGYTEDAIVRHGVSGADGQATAFLEKPFTPDTLARKVHEVLGGSPAAAR